MAELRLAGATTLAEANQLLGTFLPRFNARFAVPPTQSGSAYRPPEPALCLDGVLCFKYQRTVAKDNTVKLGERTLQLLPGLDRLSYAHARVEVQERLDGSLVVAYQGRVLATRDAPHHPVVLRARKATRSGSLSPSVGVRAEAVDPDREGAHRNVDIKGNGHKPSPHHPWRRYPAVTKSLNH